MKTTLTYTDGTFIASSTGEDGRARMLEHAARILGVRCAKVASQSVIQNGVMTERVGMTRAHAEACSSDGGLLLVTDLKS